MFALHKILHRRQRQNTYRLRKKRQKNSELCWLDCNRNVLPPTGVLIPKIKFQTFSNKAIHGGSLEPLTITAQHLAFPTQETWCHFPLLRNSDTLLLPAMRPHNIFGGIWFRGTYKLWQKEFQFPSFGLTCNPDVRIFNQSEQLSAAPRCLIFNSGWTHMNGRLKRRYAY